MDLWPREAATEVAIPPEASCVLLNFVAETAQLNISNKGNQADPSKNLKVHPYHHGIE